MKILIVSQYFWPENFRINELAVTLREKNHEVTVLTGIPNYPEGSFYEGYGLFHRVEDEYKGVRIVRVPLISRGKSKGLRLALNYLSYVVFASALGPIRCREKYDVIFVFEPSPITVGVPAIILKWLHNVPVVFWVLDLWPESLSATGAIKKICILSLVEKMVKFIYKECDLILISSKGFQSSIESKGVAAGCIHYFPNWGESLFDVVQVDLNGLVTEKIPQGFRILFAGNIGVAQDFGTILSAAEKIREYRDIHWVIVGDGRMSEWVKAEVLRRGLISNIHLLGRHPLEEMPIFFAVADAMLVTLKKDPIFSLTIPGKIQSYMAAGKPIIAAIDGEGGQLIREARAGLSCGAEDPDALAEKVLAMYHMTTDERTLMGRKGREFYEVHFERDLLLGRLEQWLQQVCSRN